MRFPFSLGGELLFTASLNEYKKWGKENKKSLNARNSRICIINFDNLWSV